MNERCNRGDGCWTGPEGCGKSEEPPNLDHCPWCGCPREQNDRQTPERADWTCGSFKHAELPWQSVACERNMYEALAYRCEAHAYDSAEGRCVCCEAAERARLATELSKARDTIDDLGTGLANCGEALACDEPWKSFNLALGEIASTPKEAAAEYRRMKAIVARLPKTADGVPVMPGNIVYYTYADCVALPMWVESFERWGYDDDGEVFAFAVGHYKGNVMVFYVADCLSTREAAEAVEQEAKEIDDEN